jgi:hypothetical protein
MMKNVQKEWKDESRGLSGGLNHNTSPVGTEYNDDFLVESPKHVRQK